MFLTTEIPVPRGRLLRSSVCCPMLGEPRRQPLPATDPRLSVRRLLDRGGRAIRERDRHRVPGGDTTGTRRATIRACARLPFHPSYAGYSYLRATMGSTRMARRAGIQQAASAT